MQADKVLREIIAREGLSPTRVSVEMGHARNYINTFYSTKRMPQVDTMAAILDACGYDLQAISRDDGFTFTIDPPV